MGPFMSDRKATIAFADQTAEFPIHSATLGNDAIDVKTLGDRGMYTLDEGFYSTAACESKITYIDGERGILLYRGYAIDDLAYHSDYLEVCYLLLQGELPTSDQKQQLSQQLQALYAVHEPIDQIFHAFSRDAHPMAMLLGAVGALSGFYHGKFNLKEPADRQLAALHLIAKMPTLAAMSYQYGKNQPFIKPEAASFAENFLNMLRAPAAKNTPIDPILIRAMDRIFTLHADHEQNASTTAVRTAGSTGASPFACIAAGISTLWGPAHGGANEAALMMLQKIGVEANIPEYIKKAKDKNDPFRLVGFGHRVYKNYDPRATVIRETCHEVLDALGKRDEPLFKLAMSLEKIALEDPYFIEKKLYPNIDFYSGIILSAMNIPTNLFTVIFTIARTVGWSSHWLELLNDPNYRLTRPRQVYTGKTKREVIPIESRDFD